MVGAMAIIGDLVPPRERGRYQGLMAGVMALAMIAGPLVGGFITDHLNWRWAFYVNLPLGGVALVWLLAAAAPAQVPHRAPHRLARARAALGRHHRAGADHHLGRRRVRLGLVADHRSGRARRADAGRVRRWSSGGWPSRSCRWSCSATATSPWSPAIGFLLGFAMFGAINFLPLYQQTVQGASATNSGLLLLPMMVAMMVVSIFAGQVITRTGRYKIFPIVGGVGMTVGMVLLSTVDVNTTKTAARPVSWRCSASAWASSCRPPC